MSEIPISPRISPLRRRMIEDMTVRQFAEKTQDDYIRHVRTFTAFVGRSPATATADDLRRFQLSCARPRRGCGHPRSTARWRR
jgi:Phage integrase, N-terminal SAM-like domain